MTLEEIAEVCWANRYIFGSEKKENWDSKIFTSKWLKKNHKDAYSKYKETNGWYWIECTEEIRNIKQKDNFPESHDNIIDWTDTSKTNESLFNKNICSEFSKNRVIYNGHADRVFNRIRSHLFVKNKKTGALGISYYDVKPQSITISIIHIGIINGLALSDEEKTEIIRYCNSTIGRRAIEIAWRVKYGWSTLCKE